MTQAIAHNISSMMRYKERIFIFLVAGIVVLASSYAYLLHDAITNVVERESVVRENRIVSTSVSELEAKYFSVKNSITIELAHAKGFKDSEVSSFISKKSLTAMANHNEL
ncbi:MAG: hypothetical protein AAB610_00440 [Patescibacteria group bacterium]